MAEATAGVRAASAHPDFKPEEKRVIFASSLGTVFEWYDFYLYATLAPFFAALFFPKGNDTAALLSSFATYAAGFLVRPFGALVFGRIGDHRRPEIHLPGDDWHHGRRDFPRRPAAYIPVDRMAGPHSARQPQTAAGAGARRRIRRGGYLRGRARRRDRRGYDTSWIQTTATLGFFLALIVIMLCRLQHREGRFRQLGLAHPVLGIPDPADLLHLHPAQAGRVAGVQEDQERGDDLQVPSDRRLRQLEERQDRAAGAARCHRGPRRGLVHGSVLRAVLSSDHAQARLPDRVYAHRHLAGDRHAVLHLLWLAVGQDRAQEHHHGGVPARRRSPTFRCSRA